MKVALLVCYCIMMMIVLTIMYTTIVYCHEKYQQSDPILHEIRENLLLLSPQVSRLYFYVDKKSYTINKQKIYLCVKDSKDNYYPINMLMYVAIHELAHVLCDEIGHTAKFHKIFEKLLDQATELGIYDPHIPIIQDYCGYKTKESFCQGSNCEK